MIKHIVLWKLKAVAEGAGKAENAATLKRELEALTSKIPQIGHIEVGTNIILSEASYDVALYSEFANEDDLAVYQQHPEHLRVAAFAGKIREERVVVDYRT